jgi:ubiquitin C-terminal hydrolase
MAELEVVYHFAPPLPRSFHRPRLTIRCTDILPPSYFRSDRALAYFELGAPARQVGGLTNIGSNCYINSVLQCLAYTPGFGAFCATMPNAMYEHNSESAFFLDSFAHVYSSMLDHKATCPEWFLHDSILLSPRFRLPYQEDAHEFLIKLLSRFGDECDACLTAPETIPSFISHYFRWKVTSELTCEHCGFCTKQETELLDWTLPIKEIPHVAAAMEDLTCGEPLRLSNQCENCKQTDCVLKRTHIFTFPLILIVTLMRFNNELRKCEDYVKFPNILAVGREAILYQLYGLIVHEGKVINHGHFTAFVRDQNDVWYRADDLCVFKATTEAVMASRPYLLFYKRVI